MSEKEFDHVSDALEKIIQGRVVPKTVAKKALKQHRRKAFNTSLTKADEKTITVNGTGEHDDSEADTPVVLKETLEKLKTENENLVTKLKKAQNNVTVKNKEIKEFERKHGMIIQEREHLRDENIKLKKEISSLYEKTSHKASRNLNVEDEDESNTSEAEFVNKEAMEKLQTENERLVAKLERTQKTMAVKDEKIKELEEKHGMIIQEGEHLREENIKLKKEVSSLYEKTSHNASRSLKVEDEDKSVSSEKESVHIEMLKMENEKLKDRTDQTENSLAIKKEKIKELERKQGMLIKEKEEAERTCERLREDNSKLKNEVSSLNDINAQKKSRSLKTEDKSTMVENIKYESSRALEKQKEDNQKLLEKLRKLETENSELSTRFQVLASQKLTSGNPDIADLSDVYRPTNLSDQFRQMYDDEWTHAYEDLEKQKLSDEIKIIEFLVNILKAIESFCEDAAGQQLVRLQHLIVEEFCYPKFQHKSGSVVAGQHRAECTITQTEIANKALKELRKSLGIISSGPLIQVFHKVYMSDFNCKEEMFTPGINSFIIEGVKLVWMMKMQDPPMQFVWAYSGEIINKNRFTHYTRSGDTVKYCVWPAVALHKDGPLMTKGIVQA